MIGKLVLCGALAGGVVAATWWGTRGVSRAQDGGAAPSSRPGTSLDDRLNGAETAARADGDVQLEEDDAAPGVVAPPPLEKDGREVVGVPGGPTPVRLEQSLGIEIGARSGSGYSFWTPPRATPEEIAKLVQDLCDDNVRYNAGSALWSLSAIGGPDVAPALERALLSPDGQQRQLAALALVRRKDYPKSQVLADEVVRALGPNDPALERRRDPETGVERPATNGFRLRRTAEETLTRDEELYEAAEPGLVNALYATDAEERLRAACVLARHHAQRGRERCLGVLIEALRDNDVRGDAAAAINALRDYGAGARAALEAASASLDQQQALLVGHVLASVAPDSAHARQLTAQEARALGFPLGDPLVYRRFGWPMPPKPDAQADGEEEDGESAGDAPEPH